MKKEATITWKEIPGFSSYEVSSNGEIRSKSRKKTLSNGKVFHLKGKVKKLRKHPDNGFFMTDLVDDKGKRKTVYPHKAVALAFIENPTPRKRKVVIHKDGDFTNNSVENLTWASYSESIKHGFKTGKRDNSDLWRKRRLKYGPNGGNNSQGRPDPLNYGQKKRIIWLRENKKMTLKELAEKFGCSASHVHKVLKTFKPDPEQEKVLQEESSSQ